MNFEPVDSQLVPFDGKVPLTQLVPAAEPDRHTRWRIVAWLRRRLTVGTDASFRGEEISGSAKRHGKRPFALFGLLSGCATYFCDQTGCKRCAFTYERLTGERYLP